MIENKNNNIFITNNNINNTSREDEIARRKKELEVMLQNALKENNFVELFKLAQFFSSAENEALRDVEFSLRLFKYLTLLPTINIKFCSLSWLEIWNTIRKEFTIVDVNSGTLKLNYEEHFVVPKLSSLCCRVIKSHQLLEPIEWCFQDQVTKYIPIEIMDAVKNNLQECNNIGCLKGITKRCGAGKLHRMTRQKRNTFYGRGRVEWRFKKKGKGINHERWTEEFVLPYLIQALGWIWNTRYSTSKKIEREWEREVKKN